MPLLYIYVFYNEGCCRVPILCLSSLINPVYSVYSVYSQQSPVYWLIPGIFCVPLTL